MPDNDTLLAYLVSSFPGNTENIATEALRHIFDHSNASVEALNDVIQSGVQGIQPISKVESQVIQADGTRRTWLVWTKPARNACLSKSSSGQPSPTTNPTVTSPVAR